MPAKATAPEKIPVATGYNTEVTYYATRYKQGGRTVYSLDLSPAQIMGAIARPDPTVRTPGNRQIRLKHAADFARYFRAQAKWVIPGLLLRVRKPFGFDTIAEAGGAEFGLLTFPRDTKGEIHIADGQHRILGFFLASDGIALDLEKAYNRRDAAKRQDTTGAIVKEAQARVDELKKQQNRLQDERLSLQIIVVEDQAEYKQMFFDIADNALGITGSLKARFDQRKVVNRALEDVLEHPLLKGRVDEEADRISGASPYWLGARHVAEIVRSVTVGLEGRVSRRQDAELNTVDVARGANEFFDVIREAFPQLQALMLGQVSAEMLRRTSLLGSVLFVRLLAGVYYDLKKNHAFTDEMIGDYFTALIPHLEVPVYPGSIWLDHTQPGSFYDGASAPTGRRQDLKNTLTSMVDWAIEKPSLLTQSPKQRPKPEPEPELDLDSLTEEDADEILRPETARARKERAKAAAH